MPQASILDLPAEILTGILTLTCEKLYGNTFAHTTTTLLTCHRFYSLTLPILYRDLEFSFPHGQKTTLLLDTLQSNPALRLLVRSLVLTFGSEYWAVTTGITVDDYMAAADVLCWCRAVHTLQIRGEERFQLEDIGGRDLNGWRWELVHYAFRHLPALQRVHMSRWVNSPGFGFGMRFDCQLRGYREWCELPGNESEDVLALKDHTCEYCARSNDDPVLQRQTTRLIEFSVAFDHTFSDLAISVEVFIFHDWLESHPHTLRRMVFGKDRFQNPGSFFRVADFSNLHTVVYPPFQLKRISPDSYDPPVAAMDRLLGPAVKTIVWDLTSYDPERAPSWDLFGEEEEQWLREFAKMAVDRNTSLQTIRIEFAPDQSTSSLESLKAGYPWDRIERLRGDIQPLGVSLEYTPPTVTREEYRKEVTDREASQRRVFSGWTPKCQLDIIRSE
ncbi:hypothetical protein BO70DRAFT_378386 [Aspergillus heteromorphus CBS 117.55]|uniref:Uncharacterized protein n=1 Tax=Aspergillus heteromorphus CBS 117.55 TaxID=1448321 RepID=A0A317WRC0_9EURO|nr:uncharacterized protein BO70DRAFT_378386 [Aspergillus heteromorphus CBS 117.55]PWY86710.1 hypothetical protein BO70DRAFT_378386 [Aspergillus heteromorphus CBS 117.55]